MSNSDRVTASREAKRLVLAINKIYMNTKEATLMDLMKRLTIKKKKRIDIRLKGRPNFEYTTNPHKQTPWKIIL
jgi:hypothetical protein